MNKESLSANRPFLQAARIALIYLVFSVLWIYAGDRLLLLVSNDSQVITTLQTYKGLLFVVASAALILYLVRHALADSYRAQRALRESEDRYRLLVENQNDLVVKVDPDGRFLYVSPTYCTLFGETEDELLGKTFMPLAHEDDREATSRKIKELFHPPYQTYLEQRALTVQGWRWLAWSDRAVLNERGTVTAIVGIGRDITDLKAAEEALQTSEAKFKVLADTSPLAIYMSAGIEQRAIYINPTFTRLFGYTLDEIPTVDHWWPLAYPDPSYRQSITNQWQEKVQAAINQKTATEPMETIVTCKDGTRKTVLWGFIDVGEQNWAYGLDITRQRAAEEHARQTLKMDSIGQLAGGIAHDFNNMLSVILGNTELALRKVAAEDPLRRKLLQIDSAAQRSAQITRQLLGFARKQAVAPQVLDLNQAIADMLDMLRRLLGETVELHWQPAAQPLWPVKMDPSQLDQLVINLCVNARDALEKNGRITIATGHSVVAEEDCAGHPDRRPGEYLSLSVEDTGCGLDKETKDKIFEPFFSTKSQSTGLGLATVYGIVTQNSGFIQVDSTPDVGTTFSIYLPRHREHSVTSRPSGKRATLPASDATVLVVEDEPDVLDLVRTQLEDMGYQVLTALSPGEARQLVASHQGRIDLLLTDLIMPQESGRELAERVKELRPDIKVLYMSGYTADVIGDHGILEDTVNFIQKPFSITDLNTSLRKVLA